MTKTKTQFSNKLTALKEGEIYKISLVATSSEWDDKEGVIGGDYDIWLDENKTFSKIESLNKWLENFGLDLKDFERFDIEDDSNRLIFNRVEDAYNEDGKFLCDYDLYINKFKLCNEDILKQFI